jgi:hypothetical protein
MMSKSFTLLLLFLTNSISMSAIEKLLVCEQMLLSTISEKLLVLLHTDLLALLHTDI